MYLQQFGVLPTGIILSQKLQIWFSGKANGFEYLDLVFWFISGFSFIIFGFLV
jgi:hypothetical protein